MTLFPMCSTTVFCIAPFTRALARVSVSLFYFPRAPSVFLPLDSHPHFSGFASSFPFFSLSLLYARPSSPSGNQLFWILNPIQKESRERDFHLVVRGRPRPMTSCTVIQGGGLSRSRGTDDCENVRTKDNHVAFSVFRLQLFVCRARARESNESVRAFILPAKMFPCLQFALYLRPLIPRECNPALRARDSTAPPPPPPNVLHS